MCSLASFCSSSDFCGDLAAAKTVRLSDFDKSSFTRARPTPLDAPDTKYVLPLPIVYAMSQHLTISSEILLTERLSVLSLRNRSWCYEVVYAAMIVTRDAPVPKCMPPICMHGDAELSHSMIT